jgi:hypothetical protein
MNINEFVKVIKENYPVLPSKEEFKKFIYKNNIDIDKSTEQLREILVQAYNRPVQRKKKNRITSDEIEELRADGYTHIEMAEYLGISTYRLALLKKELGIFHGRERTVNVDINEIREYMKFHNLTEGGLEFHKDKTTLKKIMDQNKIKGKRDFCSLWLQLKKKVDENTLKLMIELEE